MSRRAGFTLLEVVAAIVVVTILLAFAARAFTDARMAALDLFQRRAALAWTEARLAERRTGREPSPQPPADLPGAHGGLDEERGNGIVRVTAWLEWTSPSGAPRRVELVTYVAQ
jgi:prepilin-type N-terminal cleavage/methylation domain-containing protein